MSTPRAIDLRDESGMSLVELMVATLIFMIVAFTAFSTLDSGTKTERGQQARHDAMVEIRQAMDKLTRELRQATSIDTSSTHNVLRMTTLVGGAEIGVTYELKSMGGGLYQLERTLDGFPVQAIATHMVIDTTSNPDPAFCYSYYSAGAPSECIDTGHPPAQLTAIRITLAKDPEFNPGEPITLATDVQLRNM